MSNSAVAAAAAADVDEKTEYGVKCHCGRVTGKFLASKTSVTAWQCNCSDCIMRGNIHIIIPQDDFRLDIIGGGKETLEDATTLYEWGTKTAKRRFCKTCGILPWYQPRSNPDGYGITLHCVDWGVNKPEVIIETFDGENWEKFFQMSNISDQSKK